MRLFPDRGPSDKDARPAHASLTKAERKVADRREAQRKKRRIIRIGQVVMALAVVVAVVHLIGHAGAFGAQPSALADTVAGYPAAGMLFLVGAITAGR